MKRTGLIALLALALAALFLLSGCGEKLTVKKVEADPVAYLEEGGRLSLQNTPLAFLSDQPAGDGIGGEWSVSAKGFSALLSFAADSAAGKGSLDLNVKMPADAVAEGAPEKIEGSLFFDGGKLVLKSGLLGDFFGTETVGLDLAGLEDLKNTGTFRSFLALTGMTEEELEAQLGSFDEAGLKELKDKLKEAYEKLGEFVEKVRAFSADMYEVTGVTEGTVTFDGKEIKTVVVAYAVRENYYRDFMKIFEDLFNELKAVFPSEEAEEESGISFADDLFDGLSISVSGKAYLSAKTGALLRDVSEVKMTGDGEEITFSTDLFLGADPTTLPLPALDLRITAEGGEIRLQAVSSYADKKLTTDGTVTIRKNGEEEKEELSFRLEYAEDGAYTLTLTDKTDGEEKEKTLTITGVFKKEGDGLTWTANIEENEEHGIPAISLSVKLRFDAEIPAAPAYKDLLGLTEEDLTPLLAQFSEYFGEDSEEPEDVEDFESFADYAFYILTQYTDMDDDALTAALTEGYAKDGFPDATSYLYYNFAQYRAADLIQNYGAKQKALQDLWDDTVAKGATFEDLALAFEDAYLMVTAPGEAEVRAFLEQYREYGFSSRQEAADYLKDLYGDYVTIPAE